MKSKVIGIGQRLSGTSQRTGKSYDFTPIYTVRIADGVIGEKAEEISFSHLFSLKYPDDLSVGDIIQVSHDNRGFLDEFEIVERSGKIPQVNLKSNNS